MEFSGSEILPAAPEAVWAELVRAETLCACIPGCVAMSGSAEDGFDTTVEVKIGPFKPRFQGVMAMRDARYPSHYRIVGAGRGGKAGFAGGETEVRLEALPEGRTCLHYTVTAGPGGRLAKFGAPVVEAVAQHITAGFFERLAAHLAPADPPQNANDPA